MNAVTARHFFIDDDGSNHEIYVQGDFIHIKSTSFEEGERTVEEIKGTELSIAYEMVEGQPQEADLEMEGKDREPSARYQYHIPATWPACMASPGEKCKEFKQLPGLQAFFKQNVDNSILSETCLLSKNTHARVQTHIYTYKVQKPNAVPAVLNSSDAPNVYLVEFSKLA